MAGSNFRIVQSEKGYSIFEVFYDSTGRVIRRSQRPIIDCYADTACGVTDWLEAISLAAEKPSITREDIELAEQRISQLSDPDRKHSDRKNSDPKNPD